MIPSSSKATAKSSVLTLLRSTDISELTESSLSWMSVQRKGRAISLGVIVGQCKGQFTRNEESKLKVCKPYYVTTSIWQNPDFLQFVGYGTIGVSDNNSSNGISDWGDLLIFFSETPEWQTMRKFYFAGMSTDPEKLEEAMKQNAAAK